MSTTTDWSRFGYFKPGKLATSPKAARTSAGRRRLRQRKQRRENRRNGV